MVQEVNADSLKSYIIKLVSFGTRNTRYANRFQTELVLRLWVLSKFNEFAKVLVAGLLPLLIPLHCSLMAVVDALLVLGAMW